MRSASVGCWKTARSRGMRCWCAGSSAAPPTTSLWSSCSAATAGWRSCWRRRNMAAPTHLDRPSAPNSAGPAEYPHDALWDALREVEDPELGISVVDMGLIVDARRDGPDG